jgi:UDP-N-acetylglucosamine 2-epimerase (non-hydrolysing)
MVEGLGALFEERPPAAVLVQVDTNTAAAAAWAENYVGAPVVHVEAGLRSYDRAMPEELNCRVIGVLADSQYAPTEQAVQNRRHAGVPDDSILLTGNTIVEATNEMAPDDVAGARDRGPPGRRAGRIRPSHHPSPENTDDPQRLQAVLDELASSARPCCSYCTADRARRRAARPHSRAGPAPGHPRPITAPSSPAVTPCTVLKRPLVTIRNSTYRPGAH